MTQSRETEKPELQMEGPFGGILDSDFPATQKQRYKGLASALNIIFREGNAQVRSGYTALPVTPNGHQIIGIFDFFDANGVRRNGVATRDAFYQWNTGTQAWVNITGVLGGTDAQFFSSAVVGSKLCFGQGVDALWTWDGIGAALAQPAGAPTAKYFMELDNHLVTLNQAGHVQRVQWSGIGDPTDWTSFASGTIDLLNDQGPINGGIKLYQLGYLFQQWGIVQGTPTGIGVNPFAFQPILPSKGKGLWAPFSLSGFRSEKAPYLGKDNIYAFNGVDSEPIGDHPVDGNRRIGARTQILADAKYSTPTTIFGFTTTAIAGHDFNAYWLFFPATTVCWVYNFDELSWTRFQFDKVPTVAGDFFLSSTLRIADLIGAISQQLWSPSTLASSNQQDQFLIGFPAGASGSFDFASFSESAWSVTNPQWIFGDSRHTRNLIGIRVVATDLATTTATFLVVTETNQTEQHVVTYGTGSGKQLIFVVPFQINGALLELTISGAAGQAFSVSEVTPVYDVGEEIPDITVVS